MKRITLIFALSLALSGCAVFSKKAPVNPIAVPPPNTLQAASGAVATANDKLHSSVSANIETARKANATQPETPASVTVESELNLASKKLATPPDPAELLAGEQRARAIAEGRADEARKLYAEAASQANADAKARSAAESALKAALEKQESDAKKYVSDLAALKLQHREELEAARNEVMKDQVRWLNRAGAACAVLAILTVGIPFWLGGLAVFKKALPLAILFGLGALGSFGLAQIVGLWYFKWCALAVCAGVAVITGVWVWRHAKQGDLAEAAQNKADSLKSALGPIVSTFDDLYDNADEKLKASLDSAFSKIKNMMTADARATVHQIRAEDSVTKETQ